MDTTNLPLPLNEEIINLVTEPQPLRLRCKIAEK
jgi:hypothetical protein